MSIHARNHAVSRAIFFFSHHGWPYIDSAVVSHIHFHVHWNRCTVPSIVSFTHRSHPCQNAHQIFHISFISICISVSWSIIFPSSCFLSEGMFCIVLAHFCNRPIWYVSYSAWVFGTFTSLYDASGHVIWSFYKNVVKISHELTLSIFRSCCSWHWRTWIYSFVAKNLSLISHSCTFHNVFSSVIIILSNSSLFMDPFHIYVMSSCITWEYGDRGESVEMRIFRLCPVFSCKIVVSEVIWSRNP